MLLPSNVNIQQYSLLTFLCHTSKCGHSGENGTRYLAPWFLCDIVGLFLHFWQDSIPSYIRREPSIFIPSLFHAWKKKRDKMKGESIGENLEQAVTLGNGLTDDKRSWGPWDLFCEQCMCFRLRLFINLSEKQNKTKNSENGLISVQCLDKLESTLYLIAL